MQINDYEVVSWSAEDRQFCCVSCGNEDKWYIEYEYWVDMRGRMNVATYHCMNCRKGHIYKSFVERWATLLSDLIRRHDWTNDQKKVIRGTQLELNL
jgi:hypothetical protein